MTLFRRQNLSSIRILILLVSLFPILTVLYIFRGDYNEEVDFDANVAMNITYPVIYAVTPTYRRTTQMADMTRLSHTLSLIPNVHWVVIEDSVRLSVPIAELLIRAGISYTHLIGPTPGNRKIRQFGKGVAPRLEAIKWIKKNVQEGVLYFADDDNSYDLRVFEEMRWTNKVSVFPVGCINGLGLSSPIIRNHKVIGFHDPFHSGRLFAVDMAGFAVNISYLKKQSNVTMLYKLGYLEDTFLRSLNVTFDDLEPKATECTKVLVWHTKTVVAPKPSEKNMKKEKGYSDTNLPNLYKPYLY